MENDIILEVSHVSKEYRLGTIGSTTLQDDLQRLRAKLFHKEDPTLKIGQSRGEKGKTFMALSDISFTVKKGEAVGIIGHNGAGKSTLLKLITRITSPTEGEIGMNGRVASMLEVGTGFHPELTGRENIYMNGAILGMTKKEIDAKLEDIIEFSECGKFIDTPVKRYSSGMYVKLAFSVAANLDSEIMIMDEVLAVGDMAFQGKCIKKMREVADSGRTILYVSHNMNTIRQLCDRCIVLDHGRIIFDGNVEEAIACYLGNATRNELYYDLTVAEKNTDTDSEIKMQSLLLKGKTSNVYVTDETARVKLKIWAPKAYQQLKLVTVILRKDQVRVGMTESNTMDIPAGESEIEFSLTLQGLVDGNYFAEVSLVYNDAEGQFHKYEGVYDAFDFIIENPKPLRLNREWRQDIYGNTVFPMMDAAVVE